MINKFVTNEASELGAETDESVLRFDPWNELPDMVWLKSAMFTCKLYFLFELSGAVVWFFLQDNKYVQINVAKAIL